MDDHLAMQDEIRTARACLWNAVKIDRGRRAMEGAIEDADGRLEEALDALTRGDLVWTRNALAEALELLRTDEARLIAEDGSALDDAIRHIDRAVLSV